MKLETLENEIKKLLTEDEEARADDMILYNRYVFRHIGASSIELGAFAKAFIDRKYRIIKGISTYESVSRVRRKLQAKYPELRPSEETIKIRKEQEKLFKEYARGEK